MNVFKAIGTGIRVVAAFVGGVWLGLHPLFQALIILMVLDIVTGLLSGYVARKLNSDVSFRGITKKVLILLAVATAGVIGPHIGDVPLAGVVAGFYVMNEGLSILENLAEAGLPIPEVLQKALAKVNGGDGGVTP